MPTAALCPQTRRAATLLALALLAALPCCRAQTVEQMSHFAFMYNQARRRWEGCNLDCLL